MCIPLSVFSVLVALVTQITTIILFMLLSSSPSFSHKPWAHCLITSPTRNHTPFLFIFPKAYRCKASGANRSREIIRGYRSRDWRRVGPRYVGKICRPSCGTETWIIEDSRINIDETFANTVFNVCQVGCAQLPNEKTMIQSVRARFAFSVFDSNLHRCKTNGNGNEIYQFTFH